MTFENEERPRLSPDLKDPSRLNPQDRRYFPRWMAKRRVIFRLDNSQPIEECLSKDLNCTGICIRTKQDLAKDQRIHLTVYLDQHLSFSVDAVVLWRKDEGNDVLLGLHFIEMDEDVRDLIFEYAFECNKEDLIKHWYRGF